MRIPVGLPTASSLQLAVVCPASQALEVVDLHLEAGHEGTDLHTLLASAFVPDLGVDTQLATPHRLVWLDGVLECVGDRLAHAASEVAYSWRLEDGQALCLGNHLGRAYPHEAGHIYGTLDYVVHSENNGGVTLVVDLKTGLSEESPPRRHQQLLFGALVAQGWEGTGAPVQTAILHAPRDGRRPWWEWGPTYDAWDLREVADTFRAMVSRIRDARQDVAVGRTPRLAVGPHCERCPARMRCPAQTESIRLWAGSPVEAARNLEQLLDVETAGLAWARIEAVEAVIKETKRQLYAFASQQPVPLPDGRVLGKHLERGRDDVDAQRAFGRLRELVGPEKALEAMALKTSRTAIRDVVASVTSRGKKREAGDAVVRELEAAGVFQEKWTETVGVYDPHDRSVKSATSALPAETRATPPASTPVLSAGEGMEAAT